MQGDVLRHGADLAVAGAVCVFVHGRGQSPEMMVDQVIRHLPQTVAYVLPRAVGGVWYGARAVDGLTDQTRAELAASMAQVGQCLAQAGGRVPVLLAGFSQGACLALELACSGQVAPDAVVALTGARVGVAGDARPAALPRGLPVYLTGSDADPWIPLAAFAAAVADLGVQGAALRADLFPGRGHEMGLAEVAMLSSMLTDMVAGRPPGMEARR